jgi:hypothetical protein
MSYAETHSKTDSESYNDECRYNAGDDDSASRETAVPWLLLQWHRCSARVLHGGELVAIGHRELVVLSFNSSRGSLFRVGSLCNRIEGSAL